jgi:hypothetical protein
MSQEYMHKRYFELHGPYNEDDSNVTDGTTLGAITFTSTPTEVAALFAFPSVWNTNSPTKSYALEDSNKTLVVTYEFDNADDEAGFVTSVSSAYSGGSAFPTDQHVKHMKTEWYTAAGIEATDGGGHS